MREDRYLTKITIEILHKYKSNKASFEVIARFIPIHKDQIKSIEVDTQLNQNKQ